MNSNETKKSRRRYDSTFKQDVLKMIESGRSVPDVAQALGLNTSLIYQWIRLSKSPSSQKRSGETAKVFDPEKVAMQKKIRELETEREILKKALDIFSRPTQL
jgi:transposase